MTTAIRIERFDRREWMKLSENAHRVCFGTLKPAEWDRIDYALMAVAEQPVGYLTCREFDAETVYWQFGGSFPGAKGTLLSWRAYQAFVDYAQSKYKRVTTLIENDNLAMLKMALKIGFRVIGTRTFRGSILLEHLLEFDRCE